jgi:hypothetical protein
MLFYPVPALSGLTWPCHAQLMQNRCGISLRRYIHALYVRSILYVADVVDVAGIAEVVKLQFQHTVLYTAAYLLYVFRKEIGVGVSILSSLLYASLLRHSLFAVSCCCGQEWIATPRVSNRLSLSLCTARALR